MGILEKLGPRKLYLPKASPNFPPSLRTNQPAVFCSDHWVDRSAPPMSVKCKRITIYLSDGSLAFRIVFCLFRSPSTQIIYNRLSEPRKTFAYCERRIIFGQPHRGSRFSSLFVSLPCQYGPHIFCGALLSKVMSSCLLFP